MAIKSNGGIFGRSPTFNNVTVDGALTVGQIVEKTGAAGITLDDVTLKDGNVVLADGKGIDFSAASGVGTSELLDDYEEGRWTVTTNGDATGAFSNQSGTYVKVGNLVHVYCSFYVSSNFTSTGIGGLPYAAASDASLSGTYCGGVAATSTGFINFTVFNTETIFFASAPTTSPSGFRLAFSYITE